MRKMKIQKIKQVFLVGVVIGVLAGILFTVPVANMVISKREAQYEKENASLTEKNEELSLQVSKNEAAHNNAAVLMGNDAGWALALVNEEHPLDTSYVPALGGYKNRRVSPEYVGRRGGSRTEYVCYIRVPGL